MAAETVYGVVSLILVAGLIVALATVALIIRRRRKR